MTTPTPPPGLCPNCGHAWDDHEAVVGPVKRKGAVVYVEGNEAACCQARVWSRNGLPRRCGCERRWPTEAEKPWSWGDLKP